MIEEQSMTEQQNKEYMANPDHCPLCNSKDISRREPAYCSEMGNVLGLCSCETCEYDWYDVYTHTAATEVWH